MTKPKSEVQYIVDESTGCWVWQRGTNSQGYAYMQFNGRWVRASRVFYEMFNGPIPNGLHIDHLCSNRACVNPNHLEAVTQTTNTRRSRSTSLTERDVVEILKRLREGEHRLSIAREFGINERSVRDIRSGRRWHDVWERFNTEQVKK